MHALGCYALAGQLVEDAHQHRFRHDPAALQIVRAGHQHLGLDARPEALLLGDGGVTGQRVRVRLDAVAGRQAVADADHRPPFRDPGADGAVFGPPFAPALEALGDRLVGCEGQVLGALVDLDAGDDALGVQHVDERPPVGRALPQRLVVEDDAGDVRAGVRSGQQQLAIVAPVLLRAGDADPVEAPLDGARTLVGGEDALAGCDEGMRYAFKLREVHDQCLRSGREPRFLETRQMEVTGATDIGRNTNPGYRVRYLGMAEGRGGRLA